MELNEALERLNGAGLIAEARGWTAQDVVNELYRKFDPDFGGLNGWSCNVGPNNSVFIYHKDYTYKVSIKPSKQIVDIKIYAGKAQVTEKVYDFIEFDTFQSYMKYITKQIQTVGK
jgi:hypothetical protein